MDKVATSQPMDGPASSEDAARSGRRTLIKAGVVAAGGLAAVYVKPSLRRLSVPSALALSGGKSPPPPPPPPPPPVQPWLTVTPSTIYLSSLPLNVTFAWGNFPANQCENVSFDSYQYLAKWPIGSVTSGSWTVPLTTCELGWGLTPGAHTTNITFVNCGTGIATGQSVSATVTFK